MLDPADAKLTTGRCCQHPQNAAIAPPAVQTSADESEAAFKAKLVKIAKAPRSEKPKPAS
jgi:hypothetical protein